MIFQMLVGRPMFRAENEYLTFQQILNHPAEDFAYPPGFPDVARDLIDKVLLQEPKERLGAGSEEDGNGYSALKAHPFFDGIHWETLGSIQPPYIPQVNRLPATDNVSGHCLRLLAIIARLPNNVHSFVNLRMVQQRTGYLPASRPSCKCRLVWRLSQWRSTLHPLVTIVLKSVLTLTFFAVLRMSAVVNVLARL